MNSPARFDSSPENYNFSKTKRGGILQIDYVIGRASREKQIIVVVVDTGCITDPGFVRAGVRPGLKKILFYI